MNVTWFLSWSILNTRKSGSGPSLCGRGIDVESPYYRELQNCIGGMQSARWIPIEKRERWPSRANLNKNELAIYGNPYVLKWFVDHFVEVIAL